jgi:hypothetical protein
MGGFRMLPSSAALPYRFRALNLAYELAAAISRNEPAATSLSTPASPHLPSSLMFVERLRTLRVYLNTQPLSSLSFSFG